jgi:hypothetical protein
VRLSPKYLFFGIVALGLPLAVAVGWALGTPSTVPAEASAPAGAGSMGTAPRRAEPSPSGAAGGSAYRQRPASTPTTPPVTVPPVSVAPRPAGPPPVTTPDVRGSAQPTLTAPPVPTPTDVSLPPSSPLATPIDGQPPWYHHGGGAWWVRRQ